MKHYYYHLIPALAIAMSKLQKKHNDETTVASYYVLQWLVGIQFWPCDSQVSFRPRKDDIVLPVRWGVVLVYANEN